MAAKRSVTISAFLKDDAFWTIVWVTSRIKKHEDSSLMSEIAVAIAPLETQEFDANKVVKDKIRYKQDKINLVWVPVKYLRAMVPGSVWQGKDKAKCKFVPSETKKFSIIIDESMEVVHLGDKPIVPRSVYPLGPGLSSFVVIFKTSNDVKVVIGCAEILRAFYADQPVFSEAIVGGWFFDGTQKSRLYNPLRSKDETEQDPPHIQASKSLKRSTRSLALLCNLVFDKQARSRISETYRDLVASSATNKMLKLFPPANGTADIEASGFWTKDENGKWIYIVRSITQVSCPLNIKRFTWGADNDGTQAEPTDEDLPIAFDGFVRETGDDLDTDDLELTKENTSPRKPPVNIAIPEVVHVLDDIESVRIQKEEQNYQNGNGYYPNTPTKVGGAGETSEQNLSNAGIFYDTPEIINPRAMQSNLERFVKAVDHLAGKIKQCIKDNEPFTISSLARDDKAVAHEVIASNISVIYINNLPQKIKGVEYDFPKVITEAGIFQKQYLMFIIRAFGQEVLLLEVERSNQAASDVPEPATFICINRDKTFTSRDILSIVSSICMNGPTIFPSGVLSHIERQSVKHTVKDKSSTNNLGERLFKNYKKLLRLDSNGEQLQNVS